jgi:hypothetical protein
LPKPVCEGVTVAVLVPPVGEVGAAVEEAAVEEAAAVEDAAVEEAAAVEGGTVGVTMITGVEVRSCVGPPAAACQATNVAGPVASAWAGPYVKVTSAPGARLLAGVTTSPDGVQPFGTVTPTDPLGLAPQLPAV